MSNLLTTLPGDIPGLLVRGSPIVLSGLGGGFTVVIGIDLGSKLASFPTKGHVAAESLPKIALDLRDETGRSHAARWAIEHWRRMSSPQGALSEFEYRTCRDALDYRDMDRVATDDLARLVLRLAGRSS